MGAYNLHEPGDWTKKVADFKQHRSPNGRTVTLSGKCPHCKHLMSVELPIEDRSGKTVDKKPNSQKLGDEQFIEIAFCNCPEKHDARPDERAGCGAYGALKIG